MGTFNDPRKWGRWKHLMLHHATKTQNISHPKPKTQAAQAAQAQVQLTRPPPNESSPDLLLGPESKGKAYLTPRCRQRCALASEPAHPDPRSQHFPWMPMGWCPLRKETLKGHQRTGNKKG